MDNFTSVAEERKENCYVEFYKDSVHSQFKSDEAGHPVFVDCDMIRITTPGDTKTEIDTRVEEHHKRRFAAQWKKYQAGENQEVNGWKLKEWPQATSSQVKLLNYHNVFTVEQLSSISDNAVVQLGPDINSLRIKARAALKMAEDNGLVEKQASEMAEMRDQIASLTALLKQPATEEKRGPGRPKAD